MEHWRDASESPSPCAASGPLRGGCLPGCTTCVASGPGLRMRLTRLLAGRQNLGALGFLLARPSPAGAGALPWLVWRLRSNFIGTLPWPGPLTFRPPPARPSHPLRAIGLTLFDAPSIRPNAPPLVGPAWLTRRWWHGLLRLLGAGAFTNHGNADDLVRERPGRLSPTTARIPISDRQRVDDVHQRPAHLEPEATSAHCPSGHPMPPPLPKVCPGPPRLNRCSPCRFPPARASRH